MRRTKSEAEAKANAEMNKYLTDAQRKALGMPPAGGPAPKVEPHGLTAVVPKGARWLQRRADIQPRIAFSKNSPRLMSPILSIPTSRPLSTTGMRRKFLSPMYEAASRMGS